MGHILSVKSKIVCHIQKYRAEKNFGCVWTRILSFGPALQVDLIPRHRRMALCSTRFDGDVLFVEVLQRVGSCCGAVEVTVL